MPRYKITRTEIQTTTCHLEVSADTPEQAKIYASVGPLEHVVQKEQVEDISTEHTETSLISEPVEIDPFQEYLEKYVSRFIENLHNDLRRSQDFNNWDTFPIEDLCAACPHWPPLEEDQFNQLKTYATQKWIDLNKQSS
jgi:hypothetical protein